MMTIILIIMLSVMMMRYSHILTKLTHSFIQGKHTMFVMIIIKMIRTLIMVVMMKMLLMMLMMTMRMKMLLMMLMRMLMMMMMMMTMTMIMMMMMKVTLNALPVLTPLTQRKEANQPKPQPSQR